MQPYPLSFYIFIFLLINLLHELFDFARETEKVLVDPRVDVEAVVVLVVQGPVNNPVDAKLAIVGHLHRSEGDECAGRDGLHDADGVDAGVLLDDENERLVVGAGVVLLKFEEFAVFVEGKYVRRVGVRAAVAQQGEVLVHAVRVLFHENRVH